MCIETWDDNHAEIMKLNARHKITRASKGKKKKKKKTTQST